MRAISKMTCFWKNRLNLPKSIWNLIQTTVFTNTDILQSIFFIKRTLNETQLIYLCSATGFVTLCAVNREQSKITIAHNSVCTVYFSPARFQNSLPRLLILSLNKFCDKYMNTLLKSRYEINCCLV